METAPDANERAMEGVRAAAPARSAARAWAAWSPALIAHCSALVALVPRSSAWPTSSRSTSLPLDRACAALQRGAANERLGGDQRDRPPRRDHDVAGQLGVAAGPVAGVRTARSAPGPVARLTWRRYPAARRQGAGGRRGLLAAAPPGRAGDARWPLRCSGPPRRI